MSALFLLFWSQSSHKHRFCSLSSFSLQFLTVSFFKSPIVILRHSSFFTGAIRISCTAIYGAIYRLPHLMTTAESSLFSPFLFWCHWFQLMNALTTCMGSFLVTLVTHLNCVHMNTSYYKNSMWLIFMMFRLNLYCCWQKVLFLVLCPEEFRLQLLYDVYSPLSIDLISCGDFACTPKSFSLKFFFAQQNGFPYQIRIKTWAFGP